MQHRDKVLLEKIISEIDIAARIMTVRKDFPKLRENLTMILGEG